jgi:hypothetical protein
MKSIFHHQHDTIKTSLTLTERFGDSDGEGEEHEKHAKKKKIGR